MHRLAILVLVLVALPLAAQTHHIDDIEFRSRIPEKILLTQSTLTENRSYTDREIELAVARLRRLPFVYSVSSSIEGSTLIIEVIDEYRGFLFFDAFLEGRSDTGGGSGFASAEAGGRYYLPWAGVIKGSLGLFSESDSGGGIWTAEYSQYGVGPTRLFATAGVRRSGSVNEPQPYALIGYPLTLRQTVFARGARTEVSETEGVGFRRDASTSDLGIGWQWDTTDDPLFTTRGVAVNLEGARVRRDTHVVSRSGGRVFFDDEIRIDGTEWRGDADAFWPAGRGAFTASLEGQLERGDREFESNLTGVITTTDTEFRRTSLTAGYAYNFFDSITEVRRARHRLEAAVGLTEFSTQVGNRDESGDFKTIQLGYAVRSRVANIHLVLSYLAE